MKHLLSEKRVTFVKSSFLLLFAFSRGGHASHHLGESCQSIKFGVVNPFGTLFNFFFCSFNESVNSNLKRLEFGDF